jgi:hypothetical protein
MRRAAGNVSILRTCRVHREKIVFGQLFLAIELSDFRTNNIRRGVHQTSEGDRTRADASKWVCVSIGIASRVREDLQIPGSDPQIVVVKQLTPQPAPSDIHPHAIERSFDVRICHLLRGVCGGVRMRHILSCRPESPTCSTTNRERVTRRIALLCRVAG